MAFPESGIICRGNIKCTHDGKKHAEETCSECWNVEDDGEANGNKRIFRERAHPHLPLFGSKLLLLKTSEFFPRSCSQNSSALHTGCLLPRHPRSHMYDFAYVKTERVANEETKGTKIRVPRDQRTLQKSLEASYPGTAEENRKLGPYNFDGDIRDWSLSFLRWDGADETSSPQKLVHP